LFLDVVGEAVIVAHNEGYLCVLVGRGVESGMSESCGVVACFARTHAVVVPSNYLLTCVGFEGRREKAIVTGGA
jgi:hypothetical protein